MKYTSKIGIALFTSILILSCNLSKNKSKNMEQKITDKITLIVTSSPNPTPNPNEIEELKKYVQGVMPLLLDLGGTVVKRSKITDVYHGKQSFVFLLVMDFPSKKTLIKMFESEEYQTLIPNRDKGFTDINILFAEDLE